MARKTRKEKMLSDTRNFYKFQTVTPSASIIHNQAQTKTFEANDLQKTFTLTLLILALQIILFFTLKNHLISFPGITY